MKKLIGLILILLSLGLILGSCCKMSDKAEKIAVAEKNDKATETDIEADTDEDIAEDIDDAEAIELPEFEMTKQYNEALESFGSYRFESKYNGEFQTGDEDTKRDIAYEINYERDENDNLHFIHIDYTKDEDNYNECYVLGDKIYTRENKDEDFRIEENSDEARKGIEMAYLYTWGMPDQAPVSATGNVGEDNEMKYESKKKKYQGRKCTYYKGHQKYKEEKIDMLKMVMGFGGDDEIWQDEETEIILKRIQTNKTRMGIVGKEATSDTKYEMRIYDIGKVKDIKPPKNIVNS